MSARTLAPTTTRRPRRRWRRWVLAVVVLLLGAYLAAAGSAGAPWRVPGVPFAMDVPRQDVVNGGRLTTLGAGDVDGESVARVAIGDHGGPTASLRSGEWLCSQTWGCVVVTSVAVSAPVESDVDVSGGSAATVQLIYLPPPWAMGAIGLALAGAVVWWVRRRRSVNDAAR